MKEQVDMVGEMHACMEESGKGNFLVGTAGGTFIINLLAALSLDVAKSLLNNYILPLLERRFEAVREQFRTSQQLLPVSGVRGNPEAVNRHLQTLWRLNSAPTTVVTQEIEESSFIPDVTVTTTVSDQVSDESAQAFGDSIPGGLFADPQLAAVLRSSKIIRARFNLRLVSTEQEQQLEAQAQELKDLAERAMTLDENATLQIGGLTIIHKDEQGRLIMSTLRETDVPIISSVTKFGKRELMIEGCFLNGCGFKASTNSQYTNLIVFKKVKRKDGLEVICARVPEADAQILDDHPFIYAYKSVLCGAKSVIVRSEGDLIKTSRQSSNIDAPQKSHIKEAVFIVLVIFLVLGIGWVAPLSPSSSFIVILSLAMLLPGTWFVRYLSGQRSNTSMGALDGEPTTSSSGGEVDQEAIISGRPTHSPIVAHKDIAQSQPYHEYRRGSVKKRVIKDFLSGKPQP